METIANLQFKVMLLSGILILLGVIIVIGLFVFKYYRELRDNLKEEILNKYGEVIAFKGVVIEELGNFHKTLLLFFLITISIITIIFITILIV